MMEFSHSRPRAASYFDKLGMRLLVQTHLILSLSKDDVGKAG